MKVLIIHAHTANRGDEAAVKAMVDEMLTQAPDLEITISINGNTFYPSMNPKVKQISRFPVPHSVMKKMEYYLFMITNGRLCFSKDGQTFKKHFMEADLIIHAPGGPSIGDVYIKHESYYLERLSLAKKLKKKYMFYAPSMGPFENKKKSNLRRNVLVGAERVIVRDVISYNYVREFCPECHPQLALDSAFQHDVDMLVNKKKLNEYKSLNDYLGKHEKNVGITITDLKWHPKFGKTSISNQIKNAFHQFVAYLSAGGFGIVFIPQLYGSSNDSALMREFVMDGNGFVVEDNSELYDAYFQQYLISQLYAMVGMRYHSNIFSAKMGTPFLSISYEQKMKGFMESMSISQYCINVDQISADKLKGGFENLMESYQYYKNFLSEAHEEMKRKSYKSTQAVLDILHQEKSSRL